uniref:Peptidase M48 domain-containing protein n=1 Tax=candidate division WOR-3 bacterium TaxID=2052148 RepID=A0A7C4TAX6_UNCW3
MGVSKIRTFWDIEREKTNIIYLLFFVLILFYFFSFFIVWTLFKLLIYLRLSLDNPHTRFNLFGWDTLIVLALASILAIGHWFYTNSKAVDKILKLFNAKVCDKNDRYHYTFKNTVDEISTAAGKIDVEVYVLPTIAMNAFALQDIYGRNVIGVTEGLVSRLNRDEIQSVVAHEMAHIVSNDSLLTTIASSLFGVYNEILNSIVNNLNRSVESADEIFSREMKQNAMAAGIVSVPIFICLLLMSFLSQLLYVFISREKEYRADINAIKYTRNPLSLARALYKIATHYRGTASYLAPIFILSPEANPLEEREDFFAQLFSTHPPFTKRLQIILDQAHADISQVTTEIYRWQRRETTDVVKPNILVKKDDGWLGPYTLLQLQTLDWLLPDTEIKLEGSEEIKKADSIPALSHFFQIKNTPLWKIRRTCPVCNEWLIVQEYEGLYIWRCAFCDGLLVERDKLPRIIVREEKGFSEEIIRIAELIRREAKMKKIHFKLVFEIPDKRKCPRCGKPMTRKFYSYAYHIEVDECAGCNLIWFDKNELEILQCLIEMDEGKEKFLL